MDATVNEAITFAWAQIKSFKEVLGPADGEVAREYALAMTALEDASMRFNRGQAKQAGIFHQFKDVV